MRDESVREAASYEMGTPDALHPMPSAIPNSSTATDMEPPSKRPRLSAEAYGSISMRTADDLETSLEVDHMILDYLTYQAINTCFATRQPPPTPDDAAVDRALAQVDEFLALFKHRYPGYRFDNQMRFRQQLLQLVTLFTQRLTRNSTTPPRASLQALRKNNQARARRWIGSADRLPTAVWNVDPFDKELPLSNAKLGENRAYALVSLDIPAEDDAYEDEFYGTSECVALLDLFPLFVKISATCREELEIDVGSNWMRLAAEWMLHACLEQYLAFGASGADAMDEAFAWGYREASDDTSGDLRENEEDKKANDIFCDGDDRAENKEWTELKEEMLEELFLAADGNQDLATGLVDARALHPIENVENKALGYLQALSQVIPEPILIQLEKGQLAGMSKAETNDFIKTCGINMADLFGEA